jgi:hypothetical protein
MFIDENNYECNMSCFYLQEAGEVAQRQGANLRTDGVQALRKSISAYKRAGFPSQVNIRCFHKANINILLVTFYCIISSVYGLTI